MGRAATPELEEIRRVKISASGIGKHNHNGKLNPMFGKSHSPHTIELISQSARANSHAKGSRHPKLSEYNRTHIHRGADHPSYGKHYGAGIPKSPEWKAKISQIRIAKGLSKGDKNPMAKEENVAKYFKSLANSPSMPEILVDGILQRYFPGEFRYNGDFSQGIMIAGLIPDFVNVNGKKQIIEVFGERWHPIFDIAEKKERYKKYGFRVAIIWEDELKDEQRLMKVFSRKFR